MSGKSKKKNSFLFYFYWKAELWDSLSHNRQPRSFCQFWLLFREMFFRCFFDAFSMS
jgi:hypothetical protein